MINRNQFSVIVMLCCIQGCSSNYDEQTALNGYEAQRCVFGQAIFFSNFSSYDDDEYERKCEGRSVRLIAFVEAGSTGSEYILNPDDAAAIGSMHDEINDFVVEAKKPQFERTGEKVEVKGVFKGRSWLTGKAVIANASIQRLRLTRDEKLSRKSKLLAERYEKERQEIIEAYRECSTHFMLKKPGIDYVNCI